MSSTLITADKATELKQDAVATAHAAEDKAAEAAHVVQGNYSILTMEFIIEHWNFIDKATELKHDANAAAHAAGDKAAEVAHDAQSDIVLFEGWYFFNLNIVDKAAEAANVVQGKYLFVWVIPFYKNLLDKAVELKDNVVDAAHIAEDKAAEAAHTVQGKHRTI